MKERSIILARSIVADINDPFNVALLSADTLIEDPARLSDEAAAISMMGGKRLVRIEDGRDAMAPVLKDYLKNPNPNALVIIEAGELGPRSPLRLLCEKNDHAAALACYVEDERDMAGLARSILQEQGFNIAPDALQWLAAAITGDRARARSEIDKLVTYMGAIRQIGMEDVLSCCGDAGAQSFDSLVYSAGGSKPEEAFRAFRSLTEEGVPVVAILRALQNHFRRLHLGRARMERGEDPGQIIKTLSPPVFFKQEAAFRAQLQRWSPAALEKLLQRLASLEAQCKRTGMPVETLCAQAILGISSAR